MIGDRRAAIAAVIAEARADDIVCIAGKGHEQGQIVGPGNAARVIPFDDVTVAREAAALATCGPRTPSRRLAEAPPALSSPYRSLPSTRASLRRATFSSRSSAR